jgi:N-acetylglucosamine kinase-like BadF-type ATPase
MTSEEAWVVVGLDNGGNKNNGTVLEPSGGFLVADMVETPSRVQEGPDVALRALMESVQGILERMSVLRERVRAIGLDTPGPASATGSSPPMAPPTSPTPS